MIKEKKMKLFEEMLRLEKLAETTTYDGKNYNEQANGAFNMLAVLGLGREYIRWAHMESKGAKE